MWHKIIEATSNLEKGWSAEWVCLDAVTRVVARIVEPHVEVALYFNEDWAQFYTMTSADCQALLEELGIEDSNVGV
jgi:hypothetical protein